MKLVTWNVNSVRSRLDRLVAFLARHEPDIVCLQELKGLEEVFPFEPIQAAGYHSTVFGQKTYNGVAILSRDEPTDVIKGFGDPDEPARLIAATINGVRVVNVYVPNGQTIESDQWPVKLAWLARLRAWLDETADPSQRLVLCGDFNIARDDADLANPDNWADSVLCHADVRAAFTGLCDWPMVDVFRKHHPAGGVFSWWDYRRMGFIKNDGIRLDHILATTTLADACSDAFVDRDERKGEKPSDHAPVIAAFDL
jgi:exodeoxyribonuclease III